MTDPERRTDGSAGRSKKWFAIGAIAVAAIAFGIITVGGIGENLVYYWDPSQLVNAGDKAYGATIRLGGQVKAGSIVYTNQSSELVFDVTDSIQTVRVRSKGVPPQMFREGIGVVVEGTMTKDGYFDCSRLMVSHGNEYEVPEEGMPVEMEELMKSTEGLGDGGTS